MTMLNEANIEYERMEIALNEVTNKFEQLCQDLEERVNC